MNTDRFQAIVTRYPALRIALVGDFCLDRYLEIDPAKNEISIETGLTVYNVTRVRSQPGGAGTVLNNLVALGVGQIYAVSCAGEDGEGFELLQALRAKPGVCLDYWVQTAERHTFTYCKPLLIRPGLPPEELNRLDTKNWSALSPSLEVQVQQAVQTLARQVEAFILLEQVDQPNTGVLTDRILQTLGVIARQPPGLLMVGDSRRGLGHFPPMAFKMNSAELARLLKLNGALNVAEVKQNAAALARQNGHRVLVTLAEQGIVGAEPDGLVEHRPALPVRGEIDIVGAGDAVTANLTAALAAGATLAEALEMAMAAASVVIHQLGTTGTANVEQIRDLVS